MRLLRRRRFRTSPPRLLSAPAGKARVHRVGWPRRPRRHLGKSCRNRGRSQGLLSRRRPRLLPLRPSLQRGRLWPSPRSRVPRRLPHRGRLRERKRSNQVYNPVFTKLLARKEFLDPAAPSCRPWLNRRLRRKWARRRLHAPPKRISPSFRDRLLVGRRLVRPFPLPRPKHPPAKAWPPPGAVRLYRVRLLLCGASSCRKRVRGRCIQRLRLHHHRRRRLAQLRLRLE